ncbi:MAG: helix-turn-helix domain-containing protein [Firmicutes bacterium]|jgi:hypothetical protein|nr:helix-turn-helix domain-containing protein [Bacillota bacterium]
MQIVHNFNISPREYFQRGKENDFTSINICPCCAYPSTLPKHGFYWRNALFLKFHYRIPIIRFKCPSCSRTISLLPDFLLPHFQYSLAYILEAVKQFFVQRKTAICYQLLQFYRRRFQRNLNIQENNREKIALFRYGLIASLLNGQVTSKQDYLAEICSLVHQVPYYGAKEYRPKTVENWLGIYKKEGFAGLKPKQRADKGQARSIPADLRGTILELREQRRDLPVSMFQGKQQAFCLAKCPGSPRPPGIFKEGARHGAIGGRTRCR